MEWASRPPLQNIVGHPTKFYLSVRRRKIVGIGSKNCKNCEYGPRSTPMSLFIDCSTVEDKETR